MTTEQIIECFRAFNVNSFNSLAYMIETNLWMILSIAGAVAIIIMNIKEEVEDYVDEQHPII